jgi:hypothetical protein
MAEIKAAGTELKGKELMMAAIVEWNKQKSDASGGSEQDLNALESEISDHDHDQIENQMPKSNGNGKSGKGKGVK